MTLAEMLNAAAELEFEGKTYRLRKPTLLEEGEFQVYLEQCASDSIERREWKDPDDKLAAQNLVTRDCAEGYYESGGEGYVRAVSNPRRLPRLLAIICRDQGMTPQIAERLVQTEMKKIAAILISKVHDDPKSLGAVLATLGLPADYLSRLSPAHPSTTASTTSDDSRANSSSGSTPSSENREAPPG